jgi:hypothetical protein
MSLKNGRRNNVSTARVDGEHKLTYIEAKKGANTEVKQPESADMNAKSTSTSGKYIDATSSERVAGGVAALDVKRDASPSEKTDANSTYGKMHKLKEKLFKH